jgi:four helix bundle protein
MRAVYAVRVDVARKTADRGPESHVSVLEVPHSLLAVSEAKVEGPAPVLDAEKLVCYDLALELQVLCGTLAPPSHRAIQDQLERASLSVVCNIAEGAGRRSRKDKRRIYAMARGSAAETAAIVDVLRLRHLAPEGQCRVARSLAVRVIQLLTKLDKALA